MKRDVPPRDLLEIVELVAVAAGRVALQYFGRGVQVDTKADGSPVTVADRRAEETARAEILMRLPDDGIVGEELGETNPGARRRWFVDPIDGTKSFVRGAPLWGTLVGVMEGDVVIAGGIHCPVTEELVIAARGEGCWYNGARARVSGVASLDAATVLTTDERFRERPERAGPWRRLSHAAAVSRTWGDCFGYLLVATGRAEAMVDPILSPWDAVALQPVIEEAGGVFTSWSGEHTALGGDAIATNGALGDVVRAVLGEGEGRERGRR